MTTKKRLSDLLREEAQESPSEAEAIQEATSKPLEPDPTLSEPEPSHDPDQPSLLNTAAPPKRIPTKAELETTVSELREALNESHDQENSLQQQIADLKSDLQEQKILIQKLLVELEPTNQIKAELEQAKKVILQLLEDNSKNTQEVSTQRQEEDSRLKKSALKKLPHTSIQPTSSGEVFEQNVGWFD